jgi:hypothetical protein
VGKKETGVHISRSTISGSSFATAEGARASSVNVGSEASAGPDVAEAIAQLRQTLETLLDSGSLDDERAAAVDGAMGQLGGMERELRNPEPDPGRMSALMQRIREGVGDLTTVSAAVTALATAIGAVRGI